VEEVAKTEIKNLSFDDEEALAKLNEVIAQLSELQSAYPGAEIYLSGELTVDFPEDVKIPVESNQMVTAELVGSSLKLNYCGLENAIAYLRKQYVMGTVEVKIVRSISFVN
jgi:inner membrane protein